MRKGITPIIAVVLLILIAFVAIGAVAGLVDQLTNTGVTDQFQQTQQKQATEFSFDSVYEVGATNGNGDVIGFTVRNTGQREVNVSKALELYVGPEGQDTVAHDTVQQVFGEVPDGWYNTNAQYQCFAQDPNMNDPDEVVISPGESYTCSETQIRFPGGTESVNLELSMSDYDKSFTHSCDPATSDDMTC